MSAVWWVLLALPVGLALAVVVLRLWPADRTGPGQVSVEELREREDVDALPYYPPTTTGTFPIPKLDAERLKERLDEPEPRRG
ncbi:hypothetical protein N8J89_34910 [Crossiella sp. CA-258035]|uniref:hypothetical protein n=1 Tax=Crossiella sp. CA-258035 TaxID=2981138 RepID=UPI0024BC2449|nr:hypothetical protein [Crossiella sp. CA-258035]WHT18250.1 hypothetical protein N8J89_34910 [Crossiella sp. CA-258035]